MIPASKVYADSISNKEAKWPTRNDTRIEPICLPEIKPRFVFGDKVSAFTIGSCFARNIEEYLHRIGIEVPMLGFSVPGSENPGASRPNAILNKYTPHSILNELKMALQPGSIDPSDCLVEDKDGLITDLQIGGTPVSRARAMERRMEIVSLFRKIIACEAVVITLGLIESWFDKKTGLYLNQAPSRALINLHPDRFFFEVLSIDQARDAVFESIRMIAEIGGNKKILLTTSPVPLGRTFTADDVITANMYSKSLLRVVAHEAWKKFDIVDYIPSYETVMLSERRLSWNDDLRHVRDDLVGKIVKRVGDIYFGNKSGTVTNEVKYSEAMIMAAQNPGDAYKIMASLAASLGENAMFCTDLADVALKAKKFTIAHERSDAAIKKFGETAKLLNIFARSGLKTGKKALALDALRRLAILAPGNIKARLLLVENLIGEGKGPEALIQLTDMRKRLSPKTDEAVAFRVISLHDQMENQAR